ASSPPSGSEVDAFGALYTLEHVRWQQAGGARRDAVSSRGPESDFMTQSTSSIAAGLHVALILDGNGRWAERRGWPRAAGHRAGAQAVRRIVAAAPGLGVGTLTL